MTYTAPRTAFFNTKCLWTAVSLRIPDHLRDGPQPLAALAKLAGADEQRLNQVLRLLAGRGVFARDPATDTYGNNAASTLLMRDHWTQWWRWADFYGNDFYGMAQGLPGSLVAGDGVAPLRTAAQIHYGNDKPIFEHFRDEGLVDRVLGFIQAGGTAQAPGMVGDCDAWAEIAASGDPLLDVGGGSGGFMASLLRAHPTLRGAVLDTESVIAAFAPSFREPGGQFADVADRCELLVGDFFRAETIPPFKYYCMRWCLHDWPDAEAVRILANIRKAVVEAPESRLMVIEAVLTEGKSQGAVARYGDVAMMVACSGRQRTYDEWKGLAEQAGWVLARATPLRNTWVNAIELLPAMAMAVASGGGE